MSRIDDALAQVSATPANLKESPEHAARLNNLAVAYQAESRLGEADGLYRQSLAIWEKCLGPNHTRVAQSLSNRASLYRTMRQFAEAERLFQCALSIWDHQGLPTTEEMAQTELSDQKPLWAERVDDTGNVEGFRASIRDLHRRVESGADGAREELTGFLRDLGPWYHSINIAGIDTNESDPTYPARRWRHFEPFVPDDLRGKTVLDIGCDAGFFSLEMKRRGADRVVSIDIMAYRIAQVRFVSYWFDLPLEPRQVSVYDLEDLRSEFDFVVFPGVLYHLKHPLYALEKVASVCTGTLYFQSVIRGSEEDFEPADDYPASETAVFEKPAYPKLFFVEKSLNNDTSNWWLATRSCLKAMLRVAGFGDITNTTAADHFVCKKTGISTPQVG